MNDSSKEQEQEFRKYISQYTRHENRVPFGALVAYKPEADIDTVYVGWSRCSSQDQFEKDKAMKIAKSRAHKAYERRTAIMPRDYRGVAPAWWQGEFKERMAYFVKRVQKYYRTNDVRY